MGFEGCEGDGFVVYNVCGAGGETVLFVGFGRSGYDGAEAGEFGKLNDYNDTKT